MARLVNSFWDMTAFRGFLLVLAGTFALACASSSPAPGRFTGQKCAEIPQAQEKSGPRSKDPGWTGSKTAKIPEAKEKDPEDCVPRSERPWTGSKTAGTP